MSVDKEQIPNSSDILFREIQEKQTQSAVFRTSIRDVLNQSGIPSNPGWSDEEIVAELADQLGVKNRYSQINEEIRSAEPKDSK